MQENGKTSFSGSNEWAYIYFNYNWMNEYEMQTKEIEQISSVDLSLGTSQSHF